MDKINITLLLIIIICIICNTKLYYYLIDFLFSSVAPKDESTLENKILSDKLYQMKYNIETDIKKDTSIDCSLKKIKTVYYQDIKDKLNESYFEMITKKYTQPILIKNVFDIKTLQKYNFDTLSNKYGNVIVDAVAISGGEEDVKSINVPFREYIKKINNGEKYYLTVNNSLANALDISELEIFYKNIFSHYGVKNIFVGNRHSSTHLHSELAASCGIQLYGIKKWYLIEPAYSEHLHPIPDDTGIFRVSTGGFKLNPSIDHIPRYEIICEQGDFLFVPPWWWHETLNLTDNNVMFSNRPALFFAPYSTNLGYTLRSIVPSLAYNETVYPILQHANLVDAEEDTVINSLKVINHRVPNAVKKAMQ